MFIVEWWNTLALATQVFYCVAIPATLVLLIQTVLMFVGIGSQSDGIGESAEDLGDSVPDEVPDSDGVFGDNEIADQPDASGMDALRLFTVRGIVAFFVVFGWIGVVMDSAGLALWVTIPVAFLGGFVMMVGLAYMFRAVMKLRSDGNTDNRNAVGSAGKVHLTIPPARTGEGKVHVMLQGAYVERNAVTDETEPIPTGCEVVVIGISGQTDLVVKRK